jgi:hypothetical protein
MSLPITAEREVRGVDETIKDGIGDCRVDNHLVPVIDGELTGHNRRAGAVAIVDDFEQAAALLCEVSGASLQSSRIRSSTRARLLRRRTYRPSPHASAAIGWQSPSSCRCAPSPTTPVRR